MNLKKEQGITILSLLVTIIVMLILAGVSIYFSTDAMDKAKLEDIKTDMISIKTRAKIVKEQYNYKDIENLVGSKITDSEAAKLGITNSDSILKWSSEDLASQNLSSIDGNKYVVDYENNCEVYYLEGYEGMYSLTELQGL